MDLPTSTDSNKDTLLQALDIDEDGGPTDEDQAEFQILEAILKMIPEVLVSAPVIDADTSILTPRLTGQLTNGGVINQEK